ncbi:MAG TPA: alpha/beta fold hydrolase [Armatimonadota bacterium]|jgi:pimeloyl-ACP methyl ester carboxylesterase
MEHPVTIPIGEEMLVADFTPGGAEGALLLPGWGGTRYGPQRILLQTAAALAERGLATLRLDFRGRGDSTGSAAAATLDSMIEDAITAATWLTAEGVQRLHLIGICSGGNVALGAASRLPQTASLTCWSLLPFMEHKAQAARQGRPRSAMLRHLLRKVFHLESWRKLLRGEANVRGATQMLTTDKEGDAEERAHKTSSRDILAELEQYTGCLRLLYGARDPEAAGSRAFFESWCRQHEIPVDAVTIPGAPHNFYTARWTAEVIAQTVTWLTGT